MNDVKFIKYQPTPGEKHLGIATVLINGLVYLRYKANNGKQGGIFFNPASYKMTEYGQESYQEAFGCESRMLEEEVMRILRSNVSRIIESGQQSGSIFSAQTAQANQPQVHAPQAQTYQQQANYAQPMAQPAQQFPHAANTQVQAVMNQAIDGDEIPF